MVADRLATISGCQSEQSTRLGSLKRSEGPGSPNTGLHWSSLHRAIDRVWAYGGILLLNLIPLAENVSEFNRDDHNGGVGDGPPARNREVGRCAMSERLNVIFRGKYSILRRLDAILIDFDVCVTVER